MIFTESNWQEVLDKAKTEHKYIFIDIYATWCGPCKMLRNETFIKKRAGAFYNDRFVCAAFNGEAGDGVMLAKKLGVHAYPSLYILDSNGNVIGASVGYISAKELVKFGKQLVQ
jgi:thioredoxin 1